MGKIKAAESLRGIACLFVVLSHLSLVFYPQLHNFYKSNLPTSTVLWIIHNSPLSFFYSGTGAVFIFFCLSGYVLTSSIMSAQDKVKKIKASIVKRYPRLVIPSILSCVMMWFLTCFFVVDLNNVSSWFSDSIYKDYSIFDSVYYGAIESFLYGEVKYNPVLWTMQIEFLGSVLLFICLYLNMFEEGFKVVSCFLFISFFDMNVYFFLGMVSFIAGAIIYVSDVFISKKYAYFVFILGLYFIGVHETSVSYVFFYDVFSSVNSTYISYVYPVLNFLGGLLIVLSVVKFDVMKVLFCSNFLTYLGKLSFSIYLIHFGLMYIFTLPVFNFLLHIDIGFWYSSLLSVFFTFFILMPLSILFEKFVDAFAIKFSNLIVQNIN
jgi:peptidoglycan/LPS O-acetylase OafA/YrhL